MNNKQLSEKRAQIEQNNTFMFVVLGIAAAILSFTIASSISLSSRLRYQSRVINERVKAEKQLSGNKSAVTSLKSAFENFDSAPESVLGNSDKNSKIVLDALPSKYDFPAVASSIEKLVSLTEGVSLRSINGVDQEAVAEQTSINPKPIEIPLSITGTASYENIQKLILSLQLSIRPFKVINLNLDGNQESMTFDMDLITYYMPEKNIEIILKEIQ